VYTGDSGVAVELEKRWAAPLSAGTAEGTVSTKGNRFSEAAITESAL